MKASVEVPNLLAQTQVGAARELSVQHLVAKVSYEFGAGRVGTVVGQSPPSGHRVASGSTVRIAVLIPNPGGGTGPLNVVASLGPCPKTYPKTPLMKLNAGVAGLDKMLVPVTNLTVRVCKYATPAGGESYFRTALIASVLLERPASTAFTDETNRLPLTARQQFGCGSLSGPEPIGAGPTFFLTFGGHSQQVTVMAPFARSGTSRPSACAATNGFSYADPTTAWGNELQLITTAASVAVTDVVGDTSNEALSVLSGLRLVVAPTGSPCCIARVVVGQNPRAGALVPPRTTVTLTLAAPGPTGPGAPPGPTG
ncbi:MAG: PASTA domain-containing protein [Acidimicrobiia bacterium]